MNCDIDLLGSAQREEYKSRVFEFWNESEKYRTFGSEEGLDESPFRPQLRTILAECSSVLDLACGAGDNLPYMPDGIDYLGVDCSRAGIKRLLSREDHPPLTKRAVQHDVEHLPLETASYDAVISTYSFEHFLNVPGILFECDRVLKPNGILAIIGPDFRFLNNFGPPQFPGLLKRKMGLLKYAFARLWRRALFGWRPNQVLFEYIQPLPLDDSTYLPDHDMTHLTDHKAIEKFMRRLGYQSLQSVRSGGRSGVKDALKLFSFWGACGDALLVMQKPTVVSPEDRKAPDIHERLVWKTDPVEVDYSDFSAMST